MTNNQFEKQFEKLMDYQKKTLDMIFNSIVKDKNINKKFRSVLKDEEVKAEDCALEAAMEEGELQFDENDKEYPYK